MEFTSWLGTATLCCILVALSGIAITKYSQVLKSANLLQEEVNSIRSDLEIVRGDLTAVRSQLADLGNLYLRLSESTVYTDCEDVLNHGNTHSGVHWIAPDLGPSFQIYCDQKTDGGGWMVFQRRQDGTIDFHEDWDKYRRGFGDLNGEHWIGSENLHRLTANHNRRLKIRLGCSNGTIAYADYSAFSIDNEAANYKLHVAGFSGGKLPGDALSEHNEMPFSTKDRDNDNTIANCAKWHHGAWWYNKCNCSTLNGFYWSQVYSWGPFCGPLKTTVMMLK